MPSDEYKPIRGALKLKGGAPAGIKKKKKKDKDKLKLKDHEGGLKALDEKGKGKEVSKRDGDGDGDGDGGGEGGIEERRVTEEELRELESGGDGKTEAERAWEERRRRRLQEKMQKEGSKTHKEKVEQLNKYLSNLSEHHDMPRIGPG